MPFRLQSENESLNGNQDIFRLALRLYLKPLILFFSFFFHEAVFLAFSGRIALSIAVALGGSVRIRRGYFGTYPVSIILIC